MNNLIDFCFGGVGVNGSDCLFFPFSNLLELSLLILFFIWWRFSLEEWALMALFRNVAGGSSW